MPPRKYSIPSIVIASALTLFLTECSQRPKDDKISKNIQGRIAGNPDTKDAPVNVSTKAGKVTLTGTAKSQAQQRELEQIARQEPGITAIDNEITVRPELQPPVAAPPAPTPPEATTALPPAQAPPVVTPVEPPKPQPMVIPAGTVLTVRTGQALSSKTSRAGQTFVAALAQPVTLNEKRALPAGAAVTGRVLSAKEKGKIKGEGELSVDLIRISVRGHTYSIHTNALDSTVKGKGTRTAVTTGGGAAAGALVGGVAGGGRGAGIGALVGAGAGLVGGALTGNKQIEVPAETELSFTLAAPLTLPPTPPSG